LRIDRGLGSTTLECDTGGQRCRLRIDRGLGSTTLKLLAAGRSPVEGVEPALADGVAWLVERTRRGTAFAPSPIGFYFARLWYYEHLYPLVFALSALERTARLLALPRTA